MLATPGIRPIQTVAASLGLGAEGIIPYGDAKAKLPLALTRQPARGRLVLVSAITPTDAGEGKTTMSIALAQGLARQGRSVCLALREPSLGPVFGMKGGATGGGQACLHPAQDINLHFTGDFHAISSAHNLLAALLDNHLHQGNALGIDPRRVLWRRVLDLNDRALRNVVLGLGGPGEGVPRESGFDITPASEVMAVLCLARDEDDLRARLGRLVVAQTHDRQPVTAGDLKGVGAMMVLLRDALMPNLVQTGEGVPAVLHGGPFANIAHGCNSVLATRTALAHADWVVTEAGFAFDLGGEKFFDLKCVSAGLDPAAVVLVATVRALKRHAGVVKGQLDAPDPAAVERGLPNLEQHIANVRAFGREPVVALNRFPADRDDELRVVQTACAAWGVAAEVCEGYTRGGAGATALAELVVAAAERPRAPFQPLYQRTDSFQTKLEAIARRMYGARDVRLSREAEQDLARYTRLGYAELPLCVAKTHLSLSDDPKRAGRPSGFDVTVRRVLLAAGAGFLVPLLGEIVRMPGLPARPQAEQADLVDGVVVGLG